MGADRLVFMISGVSPLVASMSLGGLGCTALVREGEMGMLLRTAVVFIKIFGKGLLSLMGDCGLWGTGNTFRMTGIVFFLKSACSLGFGSA